MPVDPQVSFVLRDLGTTIENIVTKVTRKITNRLLETTPVDTGWARANWLPSVGTPILQDLTSERPSRNEILAVEAEGQAALNRITSTYTLVQGNVFITNNVPYMQELNDGSSKQAPKGFVQFAVKGALV